MTNDNGIAPQFPEQIHPVNPERNGLGLTALILGLVGIVPGLVPFTGFIAVIIGVIGIALAFAGLSRVRKNKATNKKTALFGLVFSIITLALGIWGMVITFTAVDQLGNDLDSISNDLSSYSECINKADTLDEMNACN